jgi:hypothetical protein
VSEAASGASPTWQPPSAKDVRTSVAVRQEMQKIVKFVDATLPTVLTRMGRGADLDKSGGVRNATPMPIPVSAKADGGFKEPWRIANSVNSVASKGLYEAAGCATWINLELLEKKRLAGGEEPTWTLIKDFGEHHFSLGETDQTQSLPDGASSADGVSSELPMIFPGVLEGYVLDLADLETAAKDQSYPHVRVVSAHPMVYAWYYAMAKRLLSLLALPSQTSRDRVEVLWRCGRQVTLRVRVTESPSDLALLGMEARG